MSNITISSRIEKPGALVWTCWTKPEHIMNWNAASDDWHCPKAENNLRVGGSFSSTMAARDGSFSFDFGGVYSAIEQERRIAYTLEDGRKVEVLFTPEGDGTNVKQTFEPDPENPEEMQRGGWQAILERFKGYTEAQG